MKINFETIGNATLIVSERDKTLLCTDPWFDENSAYFGSWSLSHKFPEQQRLKCENSKYIFISHFHPDHLNLRSLLKLKARNKTILLCEQYSNRDAYDLRNAGMKVIILPSRKFINLS